MVKLFQYEQIKHVKFDLYSPTEIEQLAVVEITQNRRTGDNSIYDLRMGPLNNRDACVTCKENSIRCSGHYGYIKLFQPIFHPLVFPKLENILQLICVKCYRCIHSGIASTLCLSKNAHVRFGQLCKKTKRINYCTNEGCWLEQPEISTNNVDQTVTFTIDGASHLITPAQVYFMLSNVLAREQSFMGIGCNLLGFVIFNLLVLPNAARPILKVETLICDDDLTLQYLDIVKLNTEMATCPPNTPKFEGLVNTLKFKISVMFNNSSMIARYNTNMRPFKSIYERITGKDGQFRKHVMSKRADKTARTVISPNPHLKLHQLLIPREIAQNLTIMEYVTPLTIARMQEQFTLGNINVIQKRGTTFQIDAHKYRTVKHGQLEIGDLYWRSLHDGDWVLFNRQPTLHAPSMQAMQIQIGDYKTFSFNLANCSVYNADMDGDEMNIHVPQTIEAIVEMQELSSPKNWLLSDAHNGMNFGLVQDAMLAIYLMSKNTTPLDYGTCCQFMMCGENYNLRGNTPVDIINSYLPQDFNYSSKNVTIKNGQITSGMLNKAEFGYGSHGVLQHIATEYGATCAIDILNALQFVGIAWLTTFGYTIGLRDCRDDIPDLAEAKAKFQTRYDQADTAQTQIIDQFRDELGHIIKQKINTRNNMINLIEAGSKGNWVNLVQIIGIVGQQYVNGFKVKPCVANGTLPTTGFITNSYYDGLQPVELWSHLIAAREAICKTATGTAVTGYLQRRLVKTCENQIVQYDNTIRSGQKILHFDVR